MTTNTGIILHIEGALSCLRQILGTESPLKMMKNAFYFTSKALFVFKLFKFFVLTFCYVAKRVDKNVTAWLTNKCNKHIAQHFEKSLNDGIGETIY